QVISSTLKLVFSDGTAAYSLVFSDSTAAYSTLLRKIV
ncbi:hypothetical protein A2U01_0057468, partial [Trifolium medium]|nr:hypothetical protein [Trifolium medium]